MCVGGGEARRVEGYTSFPGSKPRPLLLQRFEIFGLHKSLSDLKISRPTFEKNKYK